MNSLKKKNQNIKKVFKEYCFILRKNFINNLFIKLLFLFTLPLTSIENDSAQTKNSEFFFGISRTTVSSATASNAIKTQNGLSIQYY